MMGCGKRAVSLRTGATRLRTPTSCTLWSGGRRSRSATQPEGGRCLMSGKLPSAFDPTDLVLALIIGIGIGAVFVMWLT